jgi:hypothetical protein
MADSPLAKNFRQLLDYVSSLGDHLNLIYERLDAIEGLVNRANDDLQASITTNRQDLESLKDTMVTKSEFSDLIQKINEPFTQFSPPQPTEPRPEDEPS